MNKQYEALRLALEALKNAKDGIWSSDSDIAIESCQKAIQEIALDELVQTSQEMGGYD